MVPGIDTAAKELQIAQMPVKLPYSGIDSWLYAMPPFVDHHIARVVMKKGLCTE
jgi:hypothetical protein